ncbi:PT domain-containing protein [Eubacterium sp. MSJ-13]|uniref:CAP domain-containing protein n=1 Tax=Eubacterium sp. MSJ-13 TaxID=2841513 RepID=UPI001C11257D|nr:CAP domain-containing protein [Eubacterium sp. MSJ-13]MBU5479306.1 PT domain-containing protein [Eubacterium sp. MSJ-13]
MRLKGKKIVCLILTIVLCVTMASGYVRADDTKAQGINVIYHTQEEIKNFCNASGVTVNDKLTYAEEPVVSGSYSAGKLSDETLNSAVKMLNCVRYIAGISSDVQLNDDYNSMTQAAALVDYVNGKLSHYPEKPADMDESLYKLGADGACRSNIAWASWSGNSLNWSIINGWMEDGDSSNIDRVGHRRWILNPKMKYTGFGAVSGKKGTYSAMYSFDMKNSKASEYGVAWPAQNMPVEYFGTEYPWSVSMGKIVDITSVKVKLTRKSDGKTWNFSNDAADGYFNVNNDGYGQKGCIIFKPEMSGDYSAGDIYDVNITGLGDGNDVSYSVDFFSLAEPAQSTTQPTQAPSSKPTMSPTAEPTQKPTEQPTVSPTAKPTQKPTEQPIILPTAEPTQKPVEQPIILPTAEPTQKPTEQPTVSPTAEPTQKPTEQPTISSTTEPTQSPAEEPTVTPTTEPTQKPAEPTVTPTIEPTQKPAEEPTVSPTAKPGNNTVTSDKKPARVKIKKWSVRKNKVTVYFGKVKNISGYQLRYATDTKFKKNLKYKTISAGAAKTTLTLKKSSKKHYIQLRAYIRKNGKKVYGQWGDKLVLIM